MTFYSKSGVSRWPEGEAWLELVDMILDFLESPREDQLEQIEAAMAISLIYSGGSDWRMVLAERMAAEHPEEFAARMEHRRKSCGSPLRITLAPADREEAQ